MKVREADQGDLGAIAAVIQELGFEIGPDLLAANLGALAEQRLGPLVADAGRVIGCVTYCIMPVLHRPTPVGRISMLVVTRSWRGRGVGRALVEAAIEQLRDRGCRLCEVTSNAALVDAHSFYERLGFERTSIRLARSI